jgi:hypothetical protein
MMMNVWEALHMLTGFSTSTSTSKKASHVSAAALARGVEQRPRRRRRRRVNDLLAAAEPSNKRRRVHVHAASTAGDAGDAAVTASRSKFKSKASTTTIHTLSPALELVIATALTPSPVVTPGVTSHNRFGVHIGVANVERASWYAPDRRSIASYNVTLKRPLLMHPDVGMGDAVPIYMRQPDDFNARVKQSATRVAAQASRDKSKDAVASDETDRPYVSRHVCYLCAQVVSLAGCNHEDFGKTAHVRDCRAGIIAAYSAYPRAVADQIIVRLDARGRVLQRAARALQPLSTEMVDHEFFVARRRRLGQRSAERKRKRKRPAATAASFE